MFLQLSENFELLLVIEFLFFIVLLGLGFLLYSDRQFQREIQDIRRRLKRIILIERYSDALARSPSLPAES